jgi:hypothetical protein
VAALFSFQSGEIVGESPDPAGGQSLPVGGYDYPIPESDGLPFVQVEIQGLTPLAEDLLPERIGSK